MKTALSKSQYIRALQCHKSLWLYKARPELRRAPDEAQLAIFKSGTDVGILAQGLFPGGKVIQYEHGSFGLKLKRTRDLINMGAKTIYEATFSYENILVMVDILHKGADGWEIYEVKSSTEVKDVHVSDVAVQYYVLKGFGLDPTKVSVVYINNKYVRSGSVDVEELFATEDLTDVVRSRQPHVSKELINIKQMLHGDCPDIDIGRYCHEPYDCDFMAHCWKHISEYSVFNISNLNEGRKFELYYSGIINFIDIPCSVNLSEKQWMQVEAEGSGKVIIDREGIRCFWEGLHYPLYFLDFETFQQAIPPFDGIRPYEKIPFQYSIHYLEGEGEELKHFEFLAREGSDPREELAQNLISHIPKGVCVLAYNSSFEKGVIEKLAGQLPEYADRLANINDNIYDLIIPFRKRYYYSKEMKGSASIKDVLPALIPELSYEGMAIADGITAMNAYAGLHLLKERNKVEKIRRDLLEYCKLDTLAMVKILDKLKEALG